MQRTLRVSAAASLTDAFQELGRAFRGPKGVDVQFNFGASGALAKQIQAGAPVDVFASAAEEDMDGLEKAKLLMPGTRADFAGNRLVLIAPVGSTLSGWDGLKAPGIRRIALGSPDSVPAGRYAKATLTKRGLWVPLTSRFVFAANVRQVLTYVTTGNVSAGIVFATDARAGGAKIRVVAEAEPGKDHTPIRYPVAVIGRTKESENARAFVAYLRSAAGQAVLKRYGFTAPSVA